MIQTNPNHTYVLELNDRQSLEHESRLKLHVSATQGWGRAPRIPELTKQPTRSGYPKPLPKAPADTMLDQPKEKKTEIILPAEEKTAESVEEPQPSLTESHSEISVTPKQAEILPEIKEETTDATSLEEADPITADNGKRLRKVPGKFRDFVIYNISQKDSAPEAPSIDRMLQKETTSEIPISKWTIQSETTTEAPSLDEEDWPRLSAKKIKKRNHPIRYDNWNKTNYPIREKIGTAEDINSGDSGAISHTLINYTASTMRERYLQQETLSASSSSSDDEPEIEITQDKVGNSLLQALAEQGSGFKRTQPVETRKEANTTKVSPLPNISGSVDLKSTNKELNDLVQNSSTPNKVGKSSHIRISRVGTNQTSDKNLDIEPSDSLQGQHFLSEATITNQRDLLKYIKKYRSCRTCGARLDKSAEQSRVHAWSHFVVYACTYCGFLASHGSSINHHADREHGKKCMGIRIDSESWSEAREYYPLPEQCPPLPYDHKAKSKSKVTSKQHKSVSDKEISDLFSVTRLPITKPISPVPPTRRSVHSRLSTSKEPSPEKMIESRPPSPEPVIRSPPRKYHFKKPSKIPHTTAPVEEYIPTPISSSSSSTQYSEPMHYRTSRTTTQTSASEVQPYRMTHREQQQGISLITSQQAFLKSMKIGHMRALADIDSRIATLNKELLKFKYPYHNAY